MAGVNKVILVGNLGNDPEVHLFENNVKKVSFSLATTESYKGKDGNRVDVTEWHRIVLWSGLADIAETYLKKGNKVYLEGRIRTRSWDDKDGNKRYVTEIMGDNMVMLGSPRDSEHSVQGGSATAAVNTAVPEQSVVEDDLPF